MSLTFAFCPIAVLMSRATDIQSQRHLFRSILILQLLKNSYSLRLLAQQCLSTGLVCASWSSPTNRTTGLEKKEETAANKTEGHKSKGFLDVVWVLRDYFEKHLLPRRALTAVLMIQYICFSRALFHINTSQSTLFLLCHSAQAGMMTYLKRMHPFYFQLNYSWNYCPLVPHTWNKKQSSYVTLDINECENGSS